MSKSKERYASQLGMHVNTARTRLIRDLLWDFIKDQPCYQCGGQMTREDYTIEHKDAWRNHPNAKDLYFDLDNIAYSHASCNYSNVAPVKRRTRA